jgi:solute carrier family 35 protein E3
MSKSVSNARIILGCSINVGSSVLIVLVNKIIYSHYGFPNMALTCLHFFMTFLGLLICKNVGIFEPKKLPLIAMAPLSLTFCGFVVLTNLSLQFNTVGTYQIIKVLTMPIVMIISFAFYGKTYTFKVISTLVSLLNW